MKILFITREFPFPITSGHHMRTWHYLKGLLKAGQVSVLCYGTLENIDKEGLSIVRSQGGDVFTTEMEDLPANKLFSRLRFVFSYYPFAIKARISKILKQKAAELLAQKQFDMIICDGIHLALNIPLEASCKKILNEHNIESVIVKRYQENEPVFHRKLYSWLEWVKFSRFEDRIWKKFDAVHVCSQVDKDLILKRISHPSVAVIPNGVSCGQPVAVPQDIDREPRIVYSGLMAWWPNEDAAIYFAHEIYPRIKAKLSNMKWVIVGKNPSKNVQQLAGQDASITVTGTVPEVTPYIEKSHVVIVPLRIGSGTRLKILEAMAIGRPVVSSSIGCEGLEVTHGENIMIADDPQEFAEHIIRLFEDKDLRHKIIHNARTLACSKYDWSKIEKDVTQCISA